MAPEQKTLNILTKKIRNGIAHQQVECVDRKGKWVQVTIRDFNKANGDNLELERTWTIRELKEFHSSSPTSILKKSIRLSHEKDNWDNFIRRGYYQLHFSRVYIL